MKFRSTGAQNPRRQYRAAGPSDKILRKGVTVTVVGHRDQKIMIQMSKTNCRWFWRGNKKYKYLFHTALFTLLETFSCIRNISYKTCLYFWRNIQRNIFKNDGDPKPLDLFNAYFLKTRDLPSSKYTESEGIQIIWSNLLLNKLFLSTLVGIGVGNTARRSQDRRWEISGSFKSSLLLWVA